MSGRIGGTRPSSLGARDLPEGLATATRRFLRALVDPGELLEVRRVDPAEW